MINLKILFILNCISVALNAQEIVPNIVSKVTNSGGKEVYVFNNIQIKNFDSKSFDLKNRELSFTSLVESLPVINIPSDVINIFNEIGSYKAIPHYIAKKIFSYSEQKISDWIPKDSVLRNGGSYFDYNGKEFGGFVEVHYKICPIGRIDLNSNYYSIFMYIISESQTILLNNYTKFGEFLSSIEIVFSESSYMTPEYISGSYYRTVIDANKMIHRVFMGGAATCEKYTMVLDSSGYFKTKKIQVYYWDSVIESWRKESEMLGTISIDRVINFNTGEILKAFINDPDGYTNVREKPSTSSVVSYKINQNEPFYLITDLVNDSWYRVVLYEAKDKSGKIEKSYERGYIHKSRVRIIPKD